MQRNYMQYIQNKSKQKEKRCSEDDGNVRLFYRIEVDDLKERDDCLEEQQFSLPIYILSLTI